MDNIFRSNLKVVESIDGRIEFVESNRQKIIRASASVMALFVYVVAHFNPYGEQKLMISWDELQFLAILVAAFNLYNWRTGYVEFDEFMEKITIKRGIHKIFKPRTIGYFQVQEIYVSQEKRNAEGGHSYEIQYYFHLRLKNGDTKLLFYFDGKAPSHQAYEQLKKHSKLNVVLG